MHTFRRRCWQAIVFLFMFFVMTLTGAGSAVYNITLVTDNVPDTTDARSYLASILSSWTTDQDKAIAIWRWSRRLRRQVPNLAEDGKWTLDMMLNINNYGIMNCSGVSSLNATAAHLAGKWGFASPDFDGFKRELTDHTVMEIYYDGGYHMFDSSMSIFCYRHDGVVASGQEINSAPTSCPENQPLEQYHYYYYHPAWQCATNQGPEGWRYAADNPIPHGRTLANGASSYANIAGPPGGGYAREIRWGRRYILNLRHGEYYTRYWHMLMPFPPSGDFFRPSAWETLDQPVRHICGLCRGNGEWFFTPSLTGDGYQESIYEDSGVALLQEDEQGAKVHPVEPAVPGYVVFKVNAANVITSMDVQGEVLLTDPQDEIKVEISRDGGLNWQQVWSTGETGRVPFTIHLREEVAGHTEALVKVSMTAAGRATGVGLDGITVHTVTEVNRRALPALTLGRNRVQLRLGEQSESIVLWPTLHSEKYKETAEDYFAIYCDTDSQDAFYKAVLRTAENNVEGYVTWKIEAPTDIVGMTIYATVCNKSADSYVSLARSWNGGDFTEYFRKNDPAPPADQEVVETVEQVPTGSRQAWIKMACRRPSHAPDYFSPGLHDIVFDVRHKPRSARFAPIEVTYSWIEHRKSGDVERQHTQLVTSSEQEWTINVGGYRDPTMQWVRINLKGQGPDGDQLIYGYHDGQDVGDGKEYQKVRYLWTWEDNVARGKPYTVSRPAGTTQPDTDGLELTNGRVIAPTDYFTTQSVAPATAGWEWLGSLDASRLTVDVNLEEPVEIEGVRICTHQPSETYNHPAEIAVFLDNGQELWHKVGTISHDDLWKPPGDYEPTENDDYPDLAVLPAGGRQAYCFPLVFPREPARQVRFLFTPRAGKGMGISELEVYSDMDLEDWPADITLPDITTLRVENIHVNQQASGGLFMADVSGGRSPYVFSWDFGDGSEIEAGPGVRHSYSESGRYVVQVVVTDAAGKMAWGETAISISTGQQPADVNADGLVDLKDAILIHQLTSGQDTSEALYQDAGLNDDSRLGMGEAIHSLHNLSKRQ